MDDPLRLKEVTETLYVGNMVDASLGTFAKASHMASELPTALVYRVLDAESHVQSASTAYVVVGERRKNNPRIYDVTLHGLSFVSGHDPVPHVTFDSKTLVKKGLKLNIDSIEERDGTKVAYVTAPSRVRGHVTLGANHGSQYADSTSYTPKDGFACVVTSLVECLPGDTIFFPAGLLPSDRDTLRRSKDLNYFLYASMVNAAIMTIGKKPDIVTPSDVVEKATLRVKDGIDRSGHLLLATRLPVLQLMFYLDTVLANLHNEYDGIGLYQWEGLPIGKWHSREDYLETIDFGLSTTELKYARITSNLLLMRQLFGNNTFDF